MWLSPDPEYTSFVVVSHRFYSNQLFVSVNLSMVSAYFDTIKSSMLIHFFFFEYLGVCIRKIRDQIQILYIESKQEVECKWKYDWSPFFPRSVILNALFIKRPLNILFRVKSFCRQIILQWNLIRRPFNRFTCQVLFCLWLKSLYKSLFNNNMKFFYDQNGNLIQIIAKVIAQEQRVLFLSHRDGGAHQWLIEK